MYVEVRRFRSRSIQQQKKHGIDRSRCTLDRKLCGLFERYRKCNDLPRMS